MNPRDVKTLALVLRRTNYGEADRIIRFLTPEGQLAVLAKGVRKAHSKLAGGVEMFCLTEITVHTGKQELGILTSARPQTFYRNILSDWRRLELGSEVLRRLGRLEDVKSPDLFQVGRLALTALDDGLSCDLVEVWFGFRLAQARGEQVNLYRDVTGAPLVAEQTYEWDPYEGGLRPEARGPIGADQIKLMRLLSTGTPQLGAKVKNLPELLKAVLPVARSLE